jgi:hypothetical protein
MAQSAAYPLGEEMMPSLPEPTRDQDPERLADENLAPKPRDLVHYVISSLPPEPVERSPDVESTRRILAIIIVIALLVLSVLIVIGGMIGRFDPQLVMTTLMMLDSPVGVVCFFYFARRRF